MGKEGRKAIDVGTILQGGPKVLLEVLKLNNSVTRLANDAKEAELWQMLEMVRSSQHLNDFLRAVLELSMENWREQKLEIDQAFTKFNGPEIAKLIGMHQETYDNNPVMAHLNYDIYWLYVVETEVQEKDFVQARRLLKLAKSGLANGKPIPGALPQASKKCLTRLRKIITQSQKNNR